MARLHGNRGIVYMSTSAAGTAVPVPGLNAASLDSSNDTVDVTAFGDANKQYVLGLRDIKGTLGGWIDTTDDTLFAASISTDGVKMYIYPDRTYPSRYDYGPAWISVSQSFSSAAAVAISGSFVANGAWGHRT